MGSDSKNGVRHQRALSPRLSMMMMTMNNSHDSRLVTRMQEAARTNMHKSHDVYSHCCQLMEPDRFLTICEEQHTISTFKLCEFNIFRILMDFVIAFLPCCFKNSVLLNSTRNCLARYFVCSIVARLCQCAFVSALLGLRF